jgi:hypothetical protein
MPLEYVDIRSTYSRRTPSFDRERILERRLKRKRNHKKRHGVNKEESQIDRNKAAKAKKKMKDNVERTRTFLTLVRAYWTGAADVHP